MAENKKILVAGYYGFGNAGDELILKALLALLKKHNRERGAVVLSNSPQTTQIEHGVRAVDRWSPVALLSSVSQCDLLIFGGGGLLQDSTGLLSLGYYLFVLGAGILFRKKIWVYSAGVGPIRSGFGRLCAAWILNRAEVVTVRDGVSARFLKDIGVKAQAGIIHDPVLDLDLRASPGKKADAEHPLIAFILRSVADRRAENKLAGTLASAVRSLARDKGARISVLSLQPSRDGDFVSSLLRLCREDPSIESSAVSPFKWRDAEELVSFLSSMDAAVTMRFHGAVLSVLAGVPVVGIESGPKIPAFLDGFSLPDSRVKNVLKCEQFGEKELAESVSEYLKRGAEWKVLSEKKLAAVRARSGEENPGTILEDFFNNVR